MYVAHLEVELHIPLSHSLKEKRAVVKPIIEGARRRFQVAAAETDHHAKWQRAAVGFAAVGADAEHVTEVLRTVERFVWSFPEVEVIGTHAGLVDDA